MGLNWFAVLAASALVAGGRTAQAQPRCQPDPAETATSTATPPQTPVTPQAGLDPSQFNPGSDRVQHLLKLLTDRHAQDWANMCKYAAANAAQRQAGRPVAVFMGDSITENWIHADPAFFASGFIDRGISGQTSSQMLVRFMADVVALRPGVVHIMAGTNDIAGNTGPITDEAIEDNISAMADLAAANGIRVVLASIPPASAFPWAPTIVPGPRIRALNQWLRQFAAQRGIGYVDYYPLLADPDGGLRADYSGDGVHPGQAGYAVMAPSAREAIARALR